MRSRSPSRRNRSGWRGASTANRTRRYAGCAIGFATFSAKHPPPRAAAPVRRDLAQRRLQRDLRPGERFRDGAVLLRRLGFLLEPGAVDPRDLTLGLERDLGDREAAALRLELHLRRRVDARRLVPGLLEAEGERHREAARMRGGDQLLWVGAAAFLEARAERVVA